MCKTTYIDMKLLVSCNNTIKSIVALKCICEYLINDHLELFSTHIENYVYEHPRTQLSRAIKA